MKARYLWALIGFVPAAILATQPIKWATVDPIATVLALFMCAATVVNGALLASEWPARR